tara:strand:- start:239 stop:1240 length:1002 start_codon:yes stop_codon:yes gene_type:complete
MDLSVIVCCYRGEKTIEDCLISLCNQSYDSKMYEVIIVDDDSIDDSSKRINSFLKQKENKFPNIKYFKKKNEGLSIARNFGISKAKSDLVSFIDEDAKAEKDFILNVIKTFKENTKINCLGGKVELWNNYNYFAKIYHYGYFNALMDDDAIIGTNMSFRKSFIKDIGGFVPKFSKRGDETALFIKAGNSLSKLVCNNIIVHHMQPDSQRMFFSVRNQNGSVGYEINKFSLSYGLSLQSLFIKSLYHLSFIILPILISIFYFINYNFFLILTGFYILIFIGRFFILGHLLKPLVFLYRSNLKKSIKDYIVLIWIVFYGFFQQDLGYVKMNLLGK